MGKRSLDEQRVEFSQNRFIAMPIAGMIMWAIVGIGAFFLNPFQKSMLLYIAVGSIFYLALLIAKFTGEDILNRSKPKNTFDRLFFYSIIMALLVFSIAIPFAQQDYTSIPLTVGILTGLMWIPFSWIIEHWIGLFHAVSRTLLIVLAWYVFPEHRFITIPFIIIVIYAITIFVLEKRYQNLKKVNPEQQP